MQQYTFTIPDNLHAKELLNFILRTQIFKVDSLNETVIAFKQKEIEKKTDFWDEISNELKQEIYEAKQEIKEGKVKTHQEVFQKYEAWL